ncbi:DUF6221 family protein [Rhodococcus erythropolis]|uniref:DUF6221 family protein n=1 Tax=Rhodococcus erythropolis TaxID=1833 RepID=UPI0024BB3B76|nr:DUF6221 family protein [Rhodococcus erythropolis]MDJ0405865.1 DUF6221 family protein [Rhodococcus erythropolis]
MGIVEFLEARIAEDEAVAQDAGARAMEWRSSNGSVAGGGKPYVDDWSEDEPLTQYGGEVTIVYDEGWPEDVEAEHIARQDPDRILREVAAKRKIINDHRVGSWYVYTDDDTRACETCGDSTVRWPCATIGALAAIFSDHPDFNEEWRP